MNQSADGRQSRWRLPQGGTLQADYDGAGRTTALFKGGQLVRKQSWLQDGQLGKVEHETTAVHHEYGKDGLMSRILITPPEEDTKFDKWVSYQVDERGQAVSVTDYSGLELKVDPEQRGGLSALVSNRGRVDWKCDTAGRIETVETSWGIRQDTVYDSKGGDLCEVRLAHGESEASIGFDHGRPARLNQFDGGQFDISYNDRGSQPKEIHTPNDVSLRYSYDSAGRLETVNCDGTYELKYSYDEQGRLLGLEQVRDENVDFKS